MTDHQISKSQQRQKASFPTGQWLLVTTLVAGLMMAVVWGLYFWGGLAALPAWIASGILILVCGGLCRFLIHDVAQLRHHASTAIHAAGHSAAPPLFIPGLTGDLGSVLSHLITVWHRDKNVLTADIEALQVALDRLPDPIFMLSAEFSILQTNQVAATLFPEATHRAHLSDVFRNPELLDAVFLAFNDQKPREAEVTFSGPPLRIYRAWIARFPRTLNNGGYALLRLSDQTEVRRIEQLHADFIANASHELKTPLATLIGYIETLRGPARQDPEAAERFLTIMDNEAQRMERLIRDLLSLSNIERKEHHRPKDDAPLARIIESVAQLVHPMVEKKNQNLEIALPGDLKVIGDSDQLTQVFLNLLDNAIKYSGSGQSIRIRARLVRENKRHFVAVSVVDQGEGIDPEHLPRLSERFYRVDTPRSRSLGGTGLGLAIVKHILARHAGRLDISSHLGKGSTFTAFIPAVEEKATKEKATGRPLTF